MAVTGNRFLTLGEMTVNAQEILNYLTSKGWSKNAVCGMLGNMQTESSINPGIFENLDFGNMANGFGLVQWTPATKYIDWAQSKGYTGYASYGQLIPQLERIEYERQNNIQWNLTSPSFDDFSKSTDSPYNLAMDFLKHYEVPANMNQPLRGEQAEYWYSVLTGGAGIKPAPPVDLTKVWISYPFGWRHNPISGEYEFHRGTDYLPNDGVGIPVYAVQDGIIREKGGGSIRGNHYVIEHTADPYTTHYYHLESFTGLLAVGSPVKRGQQIGIMGTTGYSNAIHLHFAVSLGYPEDWGSPGSFIDGDIYLNMTFGGSTQTGKDGMYHAMLSKAFPFIL